MSGFANRRSGDREPVVITGRAAVSPLGTDVPAILDRLFAGESGVRKIPIDERARAAAEQFAAPVEDLPPPAGLEPEAVAGLDRLEQMCLVPLAGALADSGLDRSPGGPRIGLVLGLGAEQLKTWELDYLAGGSLVFQPRRDPTLVHRLAGRLGLTGPAVTAAAACGSSGYALALARSWIDAGWVDACLAGGCDILSPTSIAAFYTLRALSRRSGPGLPPLRSGP
jgi:3-oxoacyl-[acyl-carrier-protein] synthase II